MPVADSRTTSPPLDASRRPDKIFIDLWPWLLAIFVVALAYRGLYLLQVHQNPLFLNPVIDAEQHHAWAQRISAGSIWGSGPDDVFKPFGYPLFLGGVYYFCGPNIALIQLLQFLLGSLSAALTALLGAAVAGKRVGIIAGFVCALYAPFLFFEGQLLTASPLVFFNLVLTLMLIRRHPPWAMIGLLAGCAAGFRPDVAVPLALASGFRLLCFSRTAGVRRMTIKAVLLTAGFLAIAVPNTIRNYAVGGQWIPFSANAGINFYTGNGPAADGVSAIPTGLAWERIISTIPREIMVKPASVSRLWFSRSFEAIAGDPAAWLKLIVKKAFAFFNGLEFRNNIGYDWFRRDVPCLNMPFIQFWPVSALALLGLCLYLVQSGRNGAMGLIFFWIAGYFAVAVIFFVTARFRLPAVPFMIIAASWAAYGLFGRCAGGLRRAWPAVLGAVLVFGAAWPGWMEPAKGTDGRDLINLGNVWRKNMAPRKAIAAYEKAMEINPQEAEGWFLAGTTYLNMNQPERALSYLARAAELCPTGADIMLNRGSAYLLQGNVGRAESQYKSLVRLAEEINLYHKRSSVARAHLGLWRIYSRQGRAPAAAKHRASAWQADEQVAAEFSVMHNLDLGRAVRALERLAHEEPWNWYHRANLGVAYLKMERFDQAAAQLRQASRLKGAPPGVRLHLGLALINSGRKKQGLKILEELSEELPESGLRNEVRNILDFHNQPH